MPEHVIDAEGKLILPGSRVRVANFDPREETEAACHGVVAGISDLDVTDGDYGRPEPVWPRVDVVFDDGSKEAYVTQPTAKGPGDVAPYLCEDLELLDG